MPTCDTCNAEIDFTEAVVYTIDDVQELIQRGFGPADRIIRMAMSAGWTREQVVAKWQQELGARPQPYWMLCASCTKRAEKYLPREEMFAAEEPAPEEEAVPEAPTAEDAAGESPAAEEGPAAEIAAEVAAPGEEVEEEGVELEPLLAGKRPPLGRTFLIGLLIGLVAGAGFYLLVLDRVFHPVTPTPVPPTMAVVEAPATMTPTRPWPTRRPATPRPTEALYPPTVIPVPDLAGVALTLDDLPPGFREMPESRQEALSLTQEILAPAFDLAQGRLQLPQAFDNPNTDSLLVSFLVYPLTPEEQASFDAGLDDADAGLRPLWDILAQGGWSTPNRMARLAPLGESGLWLTSVGSNEGDGLVLEIFVVRQGPVLEFVLLGYPDDGPADLELAAPIQLLDSRVAAIVPATRSLYATPAPTPLPPDLSAVVLRKQDLPEGFVALAEVEWAAITGAEALSNTQRFSETRRQNETVFITPEGPLYVLSWVDYPLTEMESALQRKVFSNALPSFGAELLDIPIGSWRSARLLEGLQEVGEAAIGFTGVDVSGSPSMRVYVVLVYRERALITLLASYQEGTDTDLDIVDVAKALDNRLQLALP